MIEPIATSPSQGAPGDADGGGVLAACVLLFLDHHDCDGDDLAELITAFGLAHRGAALPATLHALHRQALISIDRQPIADDEPSPRVYRLTDRGRRWLHERADTLGEPARLVTRFLQRYSASRPAPPKQTRQTNPPAEPIRTERQEAWTWMAQRVRP